MSSGASSANAPSLANISEGYPEMYRTRRLGRVARSRAASAWPRRSESTRSVNNRWIGLGSTSLSAIASAAVVAVSYPGLDPKIFRVGPPGSRPVAEHDGVRFGVAQGDARRVGLAELPGALGDALEDGGEVQ